MIKKKVLWLAGAISILLGGFGVGTAAALAAHPAQIANADKLSATTATYVCKLTKGGTLTELPATMYAYYWSAIINGDDTDITAVTTEMTTVSSTENEKVFSISFSIDYGHLIFKTASDWSGRKTADLDTDFVKAFASPYSVEYAITGFSDTYGGSFVATNFPSFSDSYCRIWGDPSTTSYTYGYNWAIHYWNEAGTIDKEIPAHGFRNLALDPLNRWAGYFDVPTEIVGCYRQVKVYNGGNGSFVKSTEMDDGAAYKTYVSGDNSSLYYITETDSKLYLSKGIAAKDSAAQSIPVATIGTVLEGYFSCSADLNNGYGNFHTLTTTWIHNFADPQVWWISGDLSSISISDFDGSAADTAPYATGTPRLTPTNLYEKYLRMTALYDSMPGFGSIGFSSSEKGSNSSLIICLGAGCVAAVAIYFFLKKKKVSLA